jgi:DNA-binding NtrC family response regulator
MPFADFYVNRRDWGTGSCSTCERKTKMLSETTILVVSGKSDDSATMARILADSFRVLEAETPADAIAQLSNGVQLVVADLDSAKSEGLELLRSGNLRRPNVPLLAVANEGDVNTAVEAMKLGASDCLVKPVKAEELQAVVSRLIEDSRAAAEDTTSAGDRERKPGSQIDIPPGTSLEELERAAVEQALAQHRGNRTHAAKTLGISVRTLQRKLKAWGMPVVSMQNSSAPTNSNFVLPGHSGHSAYGAHVH